MYLMNLMYQWHLMTLMNSRYLMPLRNLRNPSSPGVCVRPRPWLVSQTSGFSVWLLQPDASSRPPASCGTEEMKVNDEVLVAAAADVVLSRQCKHLSLQPSVEAACDHTAGGGLDGDHRPQPVSKGAPHQVTTATALEPRDPLAGDVIRCTQLPGTDQSLEAREAGSHLKNREEGEDLSLSHTHTHTPTSSQRCSSSDSGVLATSSGST